MTRVVGICAAAIMVSWIERSRYDHSGARFREMKQRLENWRNNSRLKVIETFVDTVTPALGGLDLKKS